MKNTFGNNISVTLFGESHGEAIGAVLDGLPCGIKIDKAFIADCLSKRRPYGDISTSRKETDNFRILSGVNNSLTCGTPICIVIENGNVRSSDYDDTALLPRPSHADYTAFCKYGKEGVLPGGGHFSGRITAPIVAAGAIALSILKSKGILIGTHIKSIADKNDRDFSDIKEDILKLSDKQFGVLDDKTAEQMKQVIKDAKSDGDSVGGVLETAVYGLPAGIGEPWFDSLEGMLSHALFSIPGVKGIEFGLGFEIAKKRGSAVNDPFCIKDGKVSTLSNNSGGISGGISNGEAVIFRIAVKPTPTIFKEQKTVNLSDYTETVILPKGRHDPCIVHRARIVADSLTAITLIDMLFQKYGGEGLK